MAALGSDAHSAAPAVMHWLDERGLSIPALQTLRALAPLPETLRPVLDTIPKRRVDSSFHLSWFIASVDDLFRPPR